MASLATPIPATFRPSRYRFTVCVFAGSFLLFLVQPMVARMALPRLGGAPAVWNSAMLVYQALLLAGYAYAHLLGRLAPRWQAVVHLALFGLAGLSLPIALVGALPPPHANVFIWVPWLLIVSIGPLFLVISAQAPLLQRWYALAGGGDPYPLYAASNVGSFLGLITFPLLVEPLLPVVVQSRLWSASYVALALLVLACARRLPNTAPPQVATPNAQRPKPREIAQWIGLAAIPSGLMLSTTLHLTTDIVAMPLLWVVPLGLYLLSFSVAFSPNRRASLMITRAAPFMLLIAAGSLFANSKHMPFLLAGISLTSLFGICVGLHASLFDRRPNPAHLTTFYLSTSVGGVIGGIFCALVAPLSFDWTYEHPLLISAAAFALAARNPCNRFAALWNGDDRAKRLARWLGVAVLYLSFSGTANFGLQQNHALTLCGEIAIVGVAVMAIGNRTLFALALTALMLNMGGWEKLSATQAHEMTRSFFGVYSVKTVDDDGRLLFHGTTLHGMENLGSPARERMQTSYYAPQSGVGLAMRALPGIFPHARVGLVGLGAGTLACASTPKQSWRFYEIDPKIVTIARTRFHFLGRCQPMAPIVVGDARLTIAGEAPASADVLVIDAFSSDSVPMHLLTLEAFDMYRRHLAANGLLMVHISNHYLDFRPVIAAAAAHGWTARVRTYVPTPAEVRDRAAPSRWMMLSPSPETVAAVEGASGKDMWEPAPASKLPAWTDDHASILPIIKWDD